MRIVLASKSERRKEILSIYTDNFQIVESNSREVINPNFDIYTNLMSVSKDKVKSIKKDFENSVVIGADTVVILDDKILEKPKDEDEARKFLRMLSNRPHKVITSFCIYCKDKGVSVCDYEETTVFFNKLNSETIESYILSKEWEDKAGAYAIQGKGAIFIKEIEGDYLSVVGFPISKIYFYLDRYLGINLMELGNDV